MLQVDLNAQSIPTTQRVWRLFPGESYRFLDTFKENKLGFLDIPGFPVVRPLSDARDIIDRIALSQTLQDTIARIGKDANIHLDIGQFRSARRTQNRGALRNAIINFYEEAKPNDLIVMPEPVYNRNIWIGRLLNDQIGESEYEPLYGNHKIPSRNVIWYGPFRENTISSDLSLSLRQTHPFTLLERSFFLEVFSLAYGSFIYDGRHVSTIYNLEDDYLDADSSLLGVIARLASASCMAIDRGRDGLGNRDILSILLRNPDIAYTCSQAIDVHSRGFNRYQSGKIVSLVIAATVAALFGFGTLNSKEELQQVGADITVINSASNPDHDCSARVSEATNRILATLPIDKTWAMCEAAKAARKRAGLNSSAQPGRFVHKKVRK